MYICDKIIFRNNNKSSSTQPWHLFVYIRNIRAAKFEPAGKDTIHILFLETRLFSRNN